MNQGNNREIASRVFNFNEKGITKPGQISIFEQRRHQKIKLARQQYALRQFQDSGRLPDPSFDQLIIKTPEEIIKLGLLGLYFELITPAEKAEYKVNQMLELMLQKRISIMNFLNQTEFLPINTIKEDELVHQYYDKLTEIRNLQKLNLFQLKNYQGLTDVVLSKLKLKILEYHSNYNQNLLNLRKHISNNYHFGPTDENATLPSVCFSSLPDYDIDFGYFGEDKL